MRARNQLILMSDEHARRVMGCYGDPIVQTPHLDALAKRGIRFTQAYTPSPICVPARAAIATGRPIHETGHWDNAHPYEGEPRSWAHVLRERGERVVSIGKLHFRDELCDTGFSDQILPMHVENGVGDVAGSIRSPLPVRQQSRAMAANLGPGESAYTRYDRDICRAACTWLQANGGDENGWTLLVSFVSPHFPLIAPQDFYDLYRDADLYPSCPTPDTVAEHPWLTALRGSYVYDNFDDDRRHEALRNYYGLVSFLDANIGEVLSALESSGAAGDTDILYFSDHGDNLGERGMWGKSTFFEESVGVPLLYAPADETVGVCDTPVCLTDLFATLTEPDHHAGHLLSHANQKVTWDRPVLSQYHAAGSQAGAFMLRLGRYKLCYYVGEAPQLFDLEADPQERVNLAALSDHQEKLAHLKKVLTQMLGQTPEAIDARAKASQAALIAAHGGADAVLNRPKLSATSAPVMEKSS